MTDVLLIIFVIAALIIAGFALEKHSKKTRQELMDELKDESITEPAPAPEVKQLVESQEEQSIPKPAKKRRRGRPAAKKD